MRAMGEVKRLNAGVEPAGGEVPAQAHMFARLPRWELEEKNWRLKKI